MRHGERPQCGANVRSKMHRQATFALHRHLTGLMMSFMKRERASKPARCYNLDCLYEVQVNHPRTGRRECVFVAFGMVNAFWARKELETAARPTYSRRIRTDAMLKQALGL